MPVDPLKFYQAFRPTQKANAQVTPYGVRMGADNSDDQDYKVFMEALKMKESQETQVKQEQEAQAQREREDADKLLDIFKSGMQGTLAEQAPDLIRRYGGNPEAMISAPPPKLEVPPLLGKPDPHSKFVHGALNQYGGLIPPNKVADFIQDLYGRSFTREEKQKSRKASQLKAQQKAAKTKQEEADYQAEALQALQQALGI